MEQKRTRTVNFLRAQLREHVVLRVVAARDIARRAQEQVDRKRVRVLRATAMSAGSDSRSVDRNR